MTDAPKDPQRLLPLAPHLFEILISLSEKDLHGYRIVQDITERTDGDVVLGTSSLYAAMRRLVREGLVEDAGDRPSQDSGGPPRRYYRITKFGREVTRLEALRAQRVARVAKEKILRSQS